MEKRHKILIFIFSMIIISLFLSLIAFNLFLITNDEGFKITQLTDDDIDQKPIAFSPEGNKILYIQGAVDLTYDANTTEIWIMNSDGSNKEFISECYWHPYNLQFSPDGTRILFCDGTENIHSPYDIWIIDLDTKVKTKLTHDTPYNGDPIFTPDSKKIIFVSGGIWIMNIDGSNKSKISEFGGSPSISPDGIRITYTRNEDIFIMDIDGSNHIQLTNNSFEELNPSFSPKGDFILFNAIQSDPQYTIGTTWLLNLSGKKSIQLDNQNTNYTQYRISPDQTKILYVSKQFRESNPPINLYIMNFDLSNPTRLTSSGINYSPIFNNAGTKIIFRKQNKLLEDFEICLINDPTGEWDL